MTDLYPERPLPDQQKPRPQQDWTTTIAFCVFLICLTAILLAIILS